MTMTKPKAVAMMRDHAEELTGELQHALRIVLGDSPAKLADDPTRVHVEVEDLASGTKSRMSVSTAAQAIDCVMSTLFPGTGRGSHHYEDQLLAGVRVSTPFRCYQRMP